MKTCSTAVRPASERSTALRNPYRGKPRPPRQTGAQLAELAVACRLQLPPYGHDPSFEALLRFIFHAVSRASRAEIG